jgi:hypothetical protein
MPYKALEQDGSKPKKDRRRRGGKRTVKNSTTSPRKIQITKRFREQAQLAVEYRLQGYTFRQIGEEMKCDHGYVYRLVRWAMDQNPIEGVEELRAIQAARLEMMQAAVLANAFDGDAEAQDQARRNMDQYCRLLGLNKPQQVEHSGAIEGGGQAVFIITPEDASL